MVSPQCHEHRWELIEQNDHVSKSICYECEYLRMRGNAQYCPKHPDCDLYCTVYFLKPYERCSRCSQMRVKTASGYVSTENLVDVQHYYKKEELPISASGHIQL